MATSEERGVCISLLRTWPFVKVIRNGYIKVIKSALVVVLSAVHLQQPVGHGRKVYACAALRRGFKSRLHEAVCGVVL